MIELKNVSVSFEGRQVLDKFSFCFKDKGLVLITGASGSGKTTLLNLILGLLKPKSGIVNTTSKLSVVFQEDRLVPNLTALENVELVSNKAEASKRLKQMKLGDSLDLYPAKLSGGMKRRVAIARALSFPSDVLILDEAFSGIDDPLATEIIGQIANEYKDKLVIAVTHRPELFSGLDYTICKI